MAQEVTEGLQPGQPKTARNAEFLARYDRAMRLPIIVSALLPLVIAPSTNNWLTILVGVATWLVFLVDYVVHVRMIYRYRKTGFGRFDLVVVIVTAPWFLIPGAQPGEFVVLLRLARVARLVMASRGARVLFQRLGRVAIVAVSVTIVASLVAYYAEHPTNSEFATVGDAIWWGVVTLTTVGYGDIVPKTTTGRWAAVVIMLTGVSVLGLLAGSLASFFRLDSQGSPDASSTEAADEAADRGTEDGGTPQLDETLASLSNDVAELRRQLETLTARLAPDPPEGGTGSGGG
ncbi:MAG TPA: ion transporter [Acidimicrobiales bacterium]|nr:ion transporter [Acidimicrobiales bacterium]